jgi:hypothetical protein
MYAIIKIRSKHASMLVWRLFVCAVGLAGVGTVLAASLSSSISMSVTINPILKMYGVECDTVLGRDQNTADRVAMATEKLMNGMPNVRGAGERTNTERDEQQVCGQQSLPSGEQ